MEYLKEYEFYTEKIFEILRNTKKGELLYKIVSIIEVLPDYECQRILDYLVELYFSWHSKRLSIREYTAFLCPIVSWLYILVILASLVPCFGSILLLFEFSFQGVKSSNSTSKASEKIFNLRISNVRIFPASYFCTVASVRHTLSASSFNVKSFSFRYFFILLPTCVSKLPISLHLLL